MCLGSATGEHHLSQLQLRQVMLTCRIRRLAPRRLSKTACLCAAVRSRSMYACRCTSFKIVVHTVVAVSLPSADSVWASPGSDGAAERAGMLADRLSVGPKTTGAVVVGCGPLAIGLAC